MQAKDNVYDPYWEFADLEEERLKEVAKRALNKVRTEGDVKHEEGVRKEEGETGILRKHKQREKGIRKVAREKKLNKKKRVDSVLDQILH
jgi:hypothetical protein